MIGKYRMIATMILVMLMLVVFSGCVQEPSKSKLVPKILTPLPDEVVAGRVLLMAIEDSGNMALVTQAKLEFSKDGTNFTLIDSQPGLELATNPQGIDSLGSWNAIWDTAPLAPGSYFIRAEMTDQSGKTASNTIPIVIDKIPVPKMTIAFENVTGKATFDGSGSNDNERIMEYKWDFGDGQFANGSRVSHTYTNLNRNYFPMLTVVDNQGFRDTAYFEIQALEIPELWANQTATPVNDCVPIKMEVLGKDTADTTSIDFGGFAMPGDATKKKLGPFNNVNLSSPGPYDLAYWFEIKATLKAGSDPALCSEKQEIKRTYHSDNVTSHNPLPDGFNNPTYGMDDYTNRSTFKEHDGLIIKWLDAPGWHGNLAKTDVTTSGAAGVFYDAHFKASVTSKDGSKSVWCTWDLRMKVNDTGAVVTAPNISNLNCQP
ncbi:MAG: PKD domain-containing protein [Candidatus Methanoperedens sp.]|nr:PKD domain-containing protein [Candidatus Methanoperedens sp.]